MAVEPARSISDRRLYALHHMLETRRTSTLAWLGSEDPMLQAEMQPRHNVFDGAIRYVGSEIARRINLSQVHETEGFINLFSFAVIIGQDVGTPSMDRFLTQAERDHRNALVHEGYERYRMRADRLEATLPGQFGVEITPQTWRERFKAIQDSAAVLGLLLAQPRLPLPEMKEKLTYYQTRIRNLAPTP